MNLARAAVSKALNSVARWATQIYNPTPLAASNGLVYKFDTRWYWAPNKGVTKLFFGGPDDDLNFGTNKTDYQGNAVSANIHESEVQLRETVTNDPSHATLVWTRVLAGNVEGADQNWRYYQPIRPGSQRATSRPASSSTRSPVRTSTTPS